MRRVAAVLRGIVRDLLRGYARIHTGKVRELSIYICALWHGFGKDRSGGQ